MLTVALDFGGTHVSAALVEPDTWSAGRVTRLPLDADAGAETLLDQFA